MFRTAQSSRLAGLSDTKRGLSWPEVEERRARYGRNDIIEDTPGGWRDLMRDTARDPMLWFLAVTSVLFVMLGEQREALIMLAAILPLAGMDAFLHRRTHASTRGLSSRLADEAMVIRDGAQASIPAVDVVPGDLVLVTAGNSFPADGLIVDSDSAQVDESVLTGEAFPVRKQALGGMADTGEEISIDTVHWAFAGTRLLAGRTHLRVLNTGADSLYGEIVRSAIRGTHETTPLQHAISNLVTVLLLAAGVLCLVLAWVRLQQGYGILDALLSAVTLAVAAIPEEFPVVFVFFLGVGVFRLAKRHALVRRAVVVENIGRTTCICADKTGTLTEGRLRLAHQLPAEGIGDRQLLTIAGLAARTDSGDPLDKAILEVAPAPDPMPERIATYPFTEERRRETAVYRDPSRTFLVATKGAPENVLAMCRSSPSDRIAWEAQASELARSAHKVIACAWCELEAAPPASEEPVSGYRLAGLIACEDPVREGVPEAVERANAAGIHIIMVTGDHPATAVAVAREVGIGDGTPRAIEADQLDAVLARSGGKGLKDIDVIARAIPAQKASLVRALQAAGEVVAVTGDGVNDVPALQAADIGIAMGERGSRSAREFGSIVLLDDNFRTIIGAISEGRRLFQNLRLSFAYLLMIHIPLVTTAALIPLAGYPLLYLPIHIVWLELIIHPTALLAFHESSRDDHLQPMRHHAKPRFFERREWLLIGTVGAVTTLAIAFGYAGALDGGQSVEHARAMALLTLVASSAALTASLSALQTHAAGTVAVASLASAAILLQIPSIAPTLHVQPLHLRDWLIATASGAIPAVLSMALRRRRR